MKDPAFLFYPGDWLGGTLGMSFEEKGAYIDLLMLQFNRGHMTEHMIGQTVGQLWGQISFKFKQDNKGLWYNERLDIEKEKRQRYSESRRNNISGANQHTKKAVKKRGHMTKHMEDENKNENKDIIEVYWDKWKKYKKDEFNFKYKSDVSEQAAKTELLNLSGSNVETAIKIIEQSIANGWKGFFKLKNVDKNERNNENKRDVANFYATKYGSNSPNGN